MIRIVLVDDQELVRTGLLSVKTVQFHLTRVCAELGVRSRSELAARFARRTSRTPRSVSAPDGNLPAARWWTPR